MTNARIRPAVAADVPAVKAVIDAAFRPYIPRIGVAPVPMEADHTANVAAGRVFVAEIPYEGGAGAVRVAGLVVLETRPDHLYLDIAAVRPDAQGAGLGRLLLEFAETRARELERPEIRLFTNALMWENRKIYRRLGHEAVERRVTGPYDRIHYRKRLD
ncbi:GNAT family N-acetyltransferase [Streptomyces sp. DSM 41972]|uniref:GNAT family N-acetyltransferase n=1 Tax=Streptomyces althioticus subsp. attaecolombicae TaxID=3075534 RepID=A0ABU3I4I5_9ACTN|nr:GNAT family N-acetyltransferase [Streptomyces sp. DSM 41972]SCE06758.1 Acetyltransferase (GNAT) family protein [Streptomyces sp. di50b]SCE37414.1 Acetyltransferase (GNAT) family protein [Streptomyces sp. di188]